MVARSEAAHGHRNAALAHFLASYGNLREPRRLVLDHYFAQCAIEASCPDLALAGFFLSRHGVRVDGPRLLTRTDAKRMNAVMLDLRDVRRGGRVRLPGRAARQERGRRGRHGGDPRALHPVVWGPRLDAAGNSVAGIAALDRFTTASGLSVF